MTFLVLDIHSPATDEYFQLAIVRFSSMRVAFNVFHLLKSVLILSCALSPHCFVTEVRLEDAEAGSD